MMGIDNAEYWALRRLLVYTALQGGGAAQISVGHPFPRMSYLEHC